MELSWVAAASAMGLSARGGPQWSTSTLVSFTTEEECLVVDMEAALEKTGEAWLVQKFKVCEAASERREVSGEPLGKQVALAKPLPCAMAWRQLRLAVADTSGRLLLAAPRQGTLRDLSQELRRAAPSGPLVSLAWCGDVLCAARGTALVTWHDGKRRSVAVPGPVTALEVSGTALLLASRGSVYLMEEKKALLRFCVEGCVSELRGAGGAVVAAHGCHVSAWHGATLTSHAPCHALPVICLQLDTFRLLHEAELTVLSMDASGHAVLWEVSEEQLIAVRLCSLVATRLEDYLSAIEQAAVGMETRPVRAAAREKEFSQDKKIFSGFAFSPNHCLLVTQSTVPSTRTTQIRPVTFLLATALGSPSHAFSAMLQSASESLRHARAAELAELQLSLWDVAEAWRSMVLGANRSVTAMCPERPAQATEWPCGVLEALLLRLWDLTDTLQEAFEKISQTSLLQRSALAHNIGASTMPKKSFTERCATATPRLRQLLEVLRNEALLSSALPLCQLRCALWELSRRASESSGRRRLPLEPPKKTPLLMAVTKSYWKARLGDDKVNSYLEDSEVGEARHEGACRLCGEPTTMDHALMRVSCGKHLLALCQKGLKPLLLEPQVLCSFCGRCTTGGPMCAWCGHVT